MSGQRREDEKVKCYEVRDIETGEVVAEFEAEPDRAHTVLITHRPVVNEEGKVLGRVPVAKYGPSTHPSGTENIAEERCNHLAPKTT